MAVSAELQPGSGIARSTTTGFMWLMVQSLSGRVATFLSQLVLARLLLPEAFGQIGLAYTVTTLVSAFVSFGIDDVLLQRLRAIDLWVAPAFISSLGLALFGMVAMLVAAPVAAHLYGSPSLVGLIAVLAITLPLNAIAIVPTVKLRAAMNFRYLATYASLETLAVQLAAVVLAAAGFGAYSFVIPLPVAAAVRVGLFWRKAPTRLRMRYRRLQFHHMIGSGLLVLGTRMLVESVNQGDYIVLGLMATDTVVGVYFFAFRLAAQPVRMLAGNFGSVLFPALTQLRADPARQEAAALRASRILSYTVMPLCFLQAALAAPVLHLMFGARWNGAIPLMQILSLGLPGDAIAWIAGALLVARREFRRDFVYLCVTSPPFFVMVVIGSYLGSATGVAIGVSLYYAVVKPLNSWWVFRRAMGWSDLIHIYLAPPALAAVAIGLPYACSLMAPLSASALAQIVFVVALGPVIYLGLLRLFVPAILREILERFPVDRLLRKLGRQRPARRPA